MPVSRIFDWFEDVVMVACMAIITILITTQVVLRYVFNDSITWAEELTRFLVVWMSFIGAAMGVRLSGHISIDLFSTILPERQRRFLDVGVCLAGLLFAACLFVYGGRLFLHTVATGQLSSAMRMPMYLVYFIFPVSAFLLAFRFTQRAWSALRSTAGSPSRIEDEKIMPGG